MHLRPPSFSHGVTSFLWGLFLGGFVWLGLVAVGVPTGSSFLIALACGGVFFFFIRLLGGDHFPD